MQIIAIYNSRLEAEYAQGYLTNAGIRSIVVKDDAGGIHPGLGFTRPARLAVLEQDRERALELLADAGMLPGTEPDAGDVDAADLDAMENGAEDDDA
jgi:hypothetical protein